MLTTQIESLLTQLKLNQQRVLLRVAGERHWGKGLVENILSIQLSRHPESTVIRFGDIAQNTAQAGTKTVNQINDLRIKQYRSLLGQECDVLIFDAYAGFSPDALGALAGTIRAGGLCVLITPDDEHWLNYMDPEVNRLCVQPYQPEQITNYFIQRLLRILNSEQGVVTVRERQSQLFELKIEPSLLNNTTLDFQCKSQEQLKLLHSLFTSCLPNHAIVIEADRGRGKSSALGLFAGFTLVEKSKQKQRFKILVSCPKSDSIEQVFNQAESVLSQQGIRFEKEKHKLVTEQGGVLHFVAPDVLKHELADCDIVLIDEAAAIPTQLLLPVLISNNAVVFATTIHGYEGTGRGFEYKFKPLLHKHRKKVLQLRLHDPIRWGNNDMLEPCVNRLLGIDASLPECEEDIGRAEIFGFSRLTSEQLLADETLLMQVFGLLNQAHYRTSPQDLRYMLDGPNLTIYILRYEDSLIAAALVATEGQIEPELAELIWQGRRRPKGHLLPQSLIAHAGFKQAGNFKYGRVVRIAVHPKVQNYGLGSLLLTNVSKALTAQNYDFIGTSFGGSVPLFKFWQNNQFKPVRWGVKAETSTGETSLLMLKSLTHVAKEFNKQAQQRFMQQLLVEIQLNRRLQEVELVTELIEKNTELQLALNQHDMSDLHCLAYHYRGLENCLLALYRLWQNYPQLNTRLSDLIVNRGTNNKKQSIHAAKKYLAQFLQTECIK